MTMEIAILGWGSLIWRPTHCGTTLDIRPPGHWEPDGPVLPIEFARISRDGSLTLVVVPDYAHAVATLWTKSAHRELDPVIRNLAARECITENLNSIHGVRRDGSTVGSVKEAVASTVHHWLQEKEDAVCAAIWTGLGTQPRRWRDHGYRDGFTQGNALAYLRSLQGDENHPAFEYVRNTPEQIMTPVRRQAREEGLA